MTTENPTSAPRKRRLVRILAYTAGVLGVLLVALYFIGTSAAFLKGVILPSVSDSLGANVTVSDASISPFSQVVLRDLKVQAPSHEPLIVIPEVVLKYRLGQIMRGNLAVDLVSVRSPVITLVEKPDRTTNLDPLLAKLAQQPAAESAPPSTEPLRVDLRLLSITNATLGYVKEHGGGRRDVSEINRLNFSIENLRNDFTGKINLEAGMVVDQRPAPPIQASTLKAGVSGTFTFSLRKDLSPAAINGTTRLSIPEASGSLASLRDFETLLDVAIAPTEVKQIALKFLQGSHALGQLTVAGPFDLAKTEGRLNISLTGIDKKLLNLAGTPFGLDFMGTTVGSSNVLVAARNGQSYSLAGRFAVDRFQVAQTNLATPQMDLGAQYECDIDLGTSRAVLKSLALSGTQNQHQFLSGALSSPMTFSWGKTGEALGDSTLEIKLSGLQLADWKPLLGAVAPAGEVRAGLKLTSKAAGSWLSFESSAGIANLAAQAGTNRINGLNISLNAQGDITNMTQVVLPTFGMKLSHEGKDLFSTLGSGRMNLETGTSDVDVSGQLAPGPIARAVGMPPLAGATGTLDFKTLVHQTPAALAASGNVSLRDFSTTTKAGLPRLNTRIDYDTVLATNRLVLRKVLVDLSSTSRAKNQLHLDGLIDMADTNAITGKIQAWADALDVADYYDTFMGMPSAQATSQPAPGSSEPEQEPEAMKLPVRQFVSSLWITNLYLREIHASNITVGLLLDGGKVALKPCQWVLNGTPVSADLDMDLGVPGWKYGFNMNAQNVPLAPLVNSLLPERKGQMGGTVSASASVSGAGMTGASLKKNLAGQFDFGTTNLNLSVVNVKSPLLRTVIQVIAIVPEIRRNPTGALSSLAGGLLGGSTASPAWADDLSKSPIDILQASGKFGEGKISLSRALMQSAAFKAGTTGSVELGKLLDQSLVKLPLQIAVKRSLAEKINLVPAGTPTNAALVDLPDYVTLRGALGDPKTEINKMALLGTALEQLGTRVPGVDAKTGGLLQSLGGALSGRKPAATNTAPPTNTNAPSTNQPPAQNPGGLLNSLLKTK